MKEEQLLLLENSGYLNGPSCCLVYYNYRIAVAAVAIEVLAKSAILKHKMVDQIKREIIFDALRQVEKHPFPPLSSLRTKYREV
ncbi:hypothetical protein L2E82_30637 [Cichorium intybus]|uniref:Uncharacterized protein n=1 Tax=Cichorium intybus TaxID=13427 RepID=A0ACB9D0S8_CICIN|nr:hypothetical protein L2E82_30637 [Cichorium intybus]